ncbi:MAG: hypothetical protein HYS05_17825 [Acidobacteria bacterium]|nr:hypothetical protein [Acidobacteriota bacterium]
MPLLQVGVAAVDITPTTTIRLNGFATDNRKQEAALARGSTSSFDETCRLP